MNARRPVNVRKSRREYQALRARIRDAGYNQTTLADALDISRVRVCKLLGGGVIWRADEIEAVANELGLNFEEIGRMFFYKRGQDQWLP